MLSKMAAASFSGVALGSTSSAEVLSEKIGRTSKVQPGQIAGATELLFAHKMLATNVLCVQATLST